MLALTLDAFSGLGLGSRKHHRIRFCSTVFGNTSARLGPSKCRCTRTRARPPYLCLSPLLYPARLRAKRKKTYHDASRREFEGRRGEWTAHWRADPLEMTALKSSIRETRVCYYKPEYRPGFAFFASALLEGRRASSEVEVTQRARAGISSMTLNDFPLFERIVAVSEKAAEWNSVLGGTAPYDWTTSMGAMPVSASALQLLLSRSAV